MSKVKNNFRIAFVCIVTAIVCLFGYLMLQNLCAKLFVRVGWETRKAMTIFNNPFWYTFLLAVVLAPALEELIFRWLNCKVLKLLKLPDLAVILISALIFAVYHWSWSQLIYQFLMGIWLAWIFMKTQQIGWTMLIHAINNGFIVTYTYLTGAGSGEFNLTAGNIIGAVVSAVITTVAVFTLIKKGIPNYEK